MTILKMKVNDSIQLDLATNKVLDIIKFEASTKYIENPCLDFSWITVVKSRLVICAW